MDNAFKVGLIGCGNIAAAHLNAYQLLKDEGLLGNITIAALCDMNRDNALRFASPADGVSPFPGVGPQNDPMRAPHVYVTDFQSQAPRVFSDYKEMLRAMDLDAVEIYTTLHTHHVIALDALRAGKHVFVEKPLAISIKAARAMVEEAERRGLVLGVAESFRFQKAQRVKKWIIDQGLIGAPRLSISVAAGGYWSPDQIVAHTAWRHKKLLGAGGWAVDCFVHGAHARRHLFGEVEEVSGTVQTIELLRRRRDEAGSVLEEVTCDCDDTICASLFFQSGMVSHIAQSWAGSPHAPLGADVVYGTEGCIAKDLAIRNDGRQIPMQKTFADKAGPALIERYFPKGVEDVFALETLDFLRAAQGQGRMESSGLEGLMDLGVCFSLLESSATGRRVKVEDIVAGRLSQYEDPINKHYNI